MPCETKGFFSDVPAAQGTEIWRKMLEKLDFQDLSAKQPMEKLRNRE